MNLAFVSLLFRRLYAKLPHSGLPGAKIALLRLFSFQTQVCAIGNFASIIPILLSALSAAHGGRPSRMISAAATGPPMPYVMNRDFGTPPLKMAFSRMA